MKTQKLNFITIEYLADRPDCIEACASWAYGRWGVQKTESNLTKALDIFERGANKNKIPLTLVVINQKNNLPIAMGSIWPTDGVQWKDKTPWIASIYTLYRYRNLGIATKLIEHLEKETLRLGFDNIHLQSGSAGNFYRKLGYDEVETITTDASASGTETLFTKKLNATAIEET